MPEADLAPYVTTLYHMEVGQIGEGFLADWLHPEWGNLRFRDGSPVEAAVGDAPLAAVPQAVMTGPTSVCTRFRVRPGRFWGVGLLPLGWAHFCGGDASDYRDRFCDARADEACAAIAAIGDGLFDGVVDVVREAEHLQAGLRRLLDRQVSGEDRIAKVTAALVDPAVSSVAEFADHTAMSPRTLERLCRRVFGFPPKLLLRRQRFLRSLARYMMDPSMSWLGTLDSGYHDQAHFVRDFHRFMTMSPSTYAKLEHPILMAAMRGRMEAAGQAMQVLHQPAAKA
ncbi:helix-turn-helix domain-containing protein [Erythrobacter sp. SDW2]|uniref:helix-turn-helix domain-containing protein n=1 Tax=Erythrobacter sp. SDW2 TaxID=2907154 RepID=UPI001F4846A0|nr:helix-turn-helix domain-containing protein [Erythrobacter sp. SDW2]UIP07457.1 helix-turn-helix domain-containing protein [Erythrobacter sp. SDW2]